MNSTARASWIRLPTHRQTDVGNQSHACASSLSFPYVVGALVPAIAAPPEDAPVTFRPAERFTLPHRLPRITMLIPVRMLFGEECDGRVVWCIEWSLLVVARIACGGGLI